MENRCSHEEYYQQFVTPEINRIVKDRIGMEAILKSSDAHLNDIALKKWDVAAMAAMQWLRDPMHKAGDTLSLAGAVCVLKQAAKNFKRLSARD